MDRNRHLALERHPGLREFVAKALLLHSFKQPRPKMPVHAHGKADNAVGEFSARRIFGLHAVENELVWLINR